jgi:hypothetical protein
VNSNQKSKQERSDNTFNPLNKLEPNWSSKRISEVGFVDNGTGIIIPNGLISRLTPKPFNFVLKNDLEDVYEVYWFSGKELIKYYDLMLRYWMQQDSYEGLAWILKNKNS